jgi:hypothetical protein
MKSFLRLAALSAALSLSSVAVRAVEPGYVDFGKIKPTDGCEFVEVNLPATLLGFASCFVDKQDAEVAGLIRSLKHVRVNVVGYNDSSLQEITTRVQSIRRDLESQGWTQMVTARQTGQAQDVVVYVKTTDDTIQGILVTVIDPSQKQAVLVNLVGNIKPEQIAAVGRSLHIDPLAHLAIAPQHPEKGS